MAVVLMEGFDHTSSAQLAAKGWTGALWNITTGRFAGQALAMHQDVGASFRMLPSSYSTVVVGVAVQPSSTTSGLEYVYIRGGGTNVVRLGITSSGGFPVWILRNAAGTTLGTGTLHLTAGAWYYCEIKVVVSATVGSVELRVNGASTPDIVATSVNTGSTNVDQVQLGVGGSGSSSNYDDLYVVDTSGSSPTNTFLGECRVETLYPNGNGANTAWTGVYTDWDDPSSYNSDTDYVSSSTPGDRETSTLTDLAVTSGAVYAVQTNLIARKDDAGARTIAPVLRIGSTNYDGTTTPGLGSSYLDYQQLYERLDPSGAAWSVATVNAMEAGVKEVA